MKIAILTLPLHTNYGGILQAYALQTILNKMGHKVVVLDIPRTIKLPLWKWPLSYPKRILKKILGKKISIFEETKYNKEYKTINKNTLLFINKYINRKIIRSFDELKEKDYDAILVGSDQVWRPKYFKNIYYKEINNAFLSFTKGWDIKRIAYAASFGTEEWEYTPEETLLCKDAIQLFDKVSVREDSGVINCRIHLEKETEHLIDPTMLLSARDYVSLFEKAKIPQSKGNLFCYILDYTEKKYYIINEIAKNKGLIPFSVNSKAEDSSAPLNERIHPPVEEWLRGFYDAELIVTDSFHACVFSIIFKKPFIVIGNNERGMARFNSLLTMFKMKDRLISEESKVENFNIKEINSDIILDMKRKDALSFLSILDKRVNK